MVKPKSCSGPSVYLPAISGFAQMQCFMFLWFHGLGLFFSLWDFEFKKKKCRESRRKTDFCDMMLFLCLCLPALFWLTHYFGLLDLFTLSRICHWLCRCFCLCSPLGISAQVTDLQVLLKAGYWSRQTSALTQYCSSYGSHSICLISGIYQLEEKTWTLIIFIHKSPENLFS